MDTNVRRSLSFPIDPLLGAWSDRAASRKRVSKSQLVRDCLQAYLSADNDAPLAWELGKDLFGKVGSGRSDLSRNRKQIVREKLNARHRRR